MRSLVLASAAVALLSFVTGGAISQQIAGPARGSMPASQRRMNRAIPLQKFQRTTIPMSAEPRKKLRREPLPSAHMQPPASGPAGKNYTPDVSTPGVGDGLPPLILASFPGLPRTGSYPPDPVIAAGPQHLVAAANREIRFFQKDGTLLESIDAAAWFDPTAPGCVPYDPRVLYDHYAGRFLMLWHHYSGVPRASYYLLSLSTSPDPTGEWVSWALRGDVNGSTPSGTWADNGCLGFDSSAVYIVSNQYTFKGVEPGEGMEPADVKVRIIPKEALYSDRGLDISWTDFSITGAFCVRPAVVHGHADAYFMLEAINPLPFSTAVVLYRITDPVSNPVLTKHYVPVTEYSRAGDAGQPEGGWPLDTRKSYIHSEVQVLNGSLHAAFSTANPLSPAHSSIRYLRINTSTLTAVEDITFGAAGYWYFYPAVAVDRDENAIITFARSGLNEFPGTFFTWRLATDGPILRPSMLIQRGWATYQELDAYNANRWGDYSGAALDPADRQSFWLMGEYVEGRNQWGTWVKSARLVPFAAPKLILDKPVLDFGTVDLEDGPARAHISLRNGGLQPLVISGVQSSSPLFAITNHPSWPVILETYDTLSVEITFVPSDTGVVRQNIIVTSNDATNPQTEVSLEGVGVRVAVTVPDVLYAVEAGRTGDILHFLDTHGQRHASIALAGSGLRVLSTGTWDNRLYGAARANHGTEILRIDGSTGRLCSLSLAGLHGVSALASTHRDTVYCGTDTGGVYRFTPSTSELGFVTKRTGIGFSAFAASARPHQLWATAGHPVTNDTLYSIDLRTRTILPVGRTGFSVATTSMCRAPDGGLVALVGNSLVRIDTLSGKGTFVAYVALEGLCALAAGAKVTDVAAGRSPAHPIPFALAQNFPNPFNPTTVIRFQIPVFADVRLVVYDLLGREVATLVNEPKPPGMHVVQFDAKNLSSGIYFYRMDANSFVDVKKLMYLR